MRKLKLHLDALEVTTFETHDPKEASGTVQARSVDTILDQCVTRIVGVCTGLPVGCSIVLPFCTATCTE